MHRQINTGSNECQKRERNDDLTICNKNKAKNVKKFWHQILLQYTIVLYVSDVTRILVAEYSNTIQFLLVTFNKNI